MDQKDEDLVKMTVGSNNAQRVLLRASFVARMLGKAAAAESKVNRQESQWLRSVADFLDEVLEPVRADLTACGFKFEVPQAELSEAFMQCLDANDLQIERLKIPRDNPDKEAVFTAKFRP